MFYFTSLLFVVLSILPTVLSFFFVPEGNRERLFVLIVLSGFAVLKLILKGGFKLIKQFRLDGFSMFLIATSILSGVHLFFDPKPSSINYVDFIAPYTLIISLIYIPNNTANNEMERVIKILITLWIFIGTVELCLGLIYGTDWICSSGCIYYENRPNASRPLQALLGIDQFISLESLGLNTQEFSIILGIAFLLLLDEMRFSVSFKKVFIAFVILTLHIFSLSFNVLIAELLSSLIFYIAIFFRNKTAFNKFQLIFTLILLSFLTWILLPNIKYLGFKFFLEPQYYYEVLFFEPINFLRHLQAHEILFGIDKINYYPAENRWFVLVYRFGLLWFMMIVFGVVHYLKKIISLKLAKGSIKWFVISLYILIASFHNNLWHTISGILIFCMLLVNLYYFLKLNQNINYAHN